MSKSQLLINEPPLQVLPSLAIAIGLNEAIVLQQLHYWLNNLKAGVERNGFKWIFNTYEEWQEGNFPFWSVSTVKRTFASLEEQKVVIAEQLDVKQRDMTKFYRIDYDHLGTLEEVNLTRWNGSKRADVKDESETITEKISILGIESAMFQGRPVTEEDIDGSAFEKEALTTFEKDMQLPGNWVWYPGKTSEEKEWKSLREFVVKVYRNDRKAFEKYHTWRNQPYVKGSMSNRAIKKDPADFEISWSDYLAHSEMYGKKTNESRPVYKPTEEPEYVPAPPRK